MPIPEGLPSYDGYEPMDDGEKLVDCVLFPRRNIGLYGASPVPLSGINSFTRGRVYSEVVGIQLNEDFYPYRKIRTFEGMPEGIVPEPGWFPIPDDEPILKTDKWFYIPRYNKGSSAPTASVGSTVKSWLKKQGVMPVCWVFRYGYQPVETKGGTTTRPRMRYPLHAQFSAPLPLP
jgi:hypothetical protein